MHELAYSIYMIENVMLIAYCVLKDLKDLKGQVSVIQHLTYIFILKPNISIMNQIHSCF